MFKKKMYRTLMLMVALALGYGSMIFAGPIIGDVPSSESETRTIQEESTLYTSSCDIEQNLAFYEGSDVYLRVAQPKTVVNYVFDKAETYVRVYGGDIFGGSLSFPYISNFIPSTTTDTESTTILSVVAEGGIFEGQDTVARNVVAGQIVTKNMLRTLLLLSNGDSLNYYYRRASDNSVHNGNIVGVINPTVTEKTTCTNYYVGRCGDGIVDNGAGGIDTATAGYLARHALSVVPSEQCDDGNTVDGDGCSSTCQFDAPQEPACNSLVATPPTGDETTQYDVTCYGTNASAYELTITNSLGDIVYTNTVTTTDSFYTRAGLGALPAGNNTVSCTVLGGDGTQPSACPDTNIIVTPTVSIVPECTIIGYDSNGDPINGTIPLNTSGTLNLSTTFECVVTNGAALGTNPYQFSATLNGQNAFTSPRQAENAYDYDIMTAGAMTANCSVQNTAGEIGNCDTSFNIETQNADLNVTKTIVANPSIPSGQYHPGDEITFRIDFSNTGSGTATNVDIRDIFPNSIDLNTSEIIVSGIGAPYTNGIYSNGVNTVVEYSGFTLAPGATGYIILKGIVKGYERSDQTTNHGYIDSDNAELAHTHIMFNYAAPDANVTITKTASIAATYPGGDINFTINITNNGDTITDLQINDIRPDMTCLTSEATIVSNIPLQTNGDYSWTLPGSFSQGQTLTMTIMGHVVDADACAAVGTYTNTATYDYTLAGEQHVGQASVSFNVIPNITNIDFQKNILQAGSSAGDLVSYELVYTNNGTIPLGGFVVTDIWPATLEFISSSWIPITTLGCDNGCTLTFQLAGVLNQGESASLVLTGRIK